VCLSVAISLIPAAAAAAASISCLFSARSHAESHLLPGEEVGIIAELAEFSE